MNKIETRYSVTFFEKDKITTFCKFQTNEDGSLGEPNPNFEKEVKIFIEKKQS